MTILTLAYWLGVLVAVVALALLVALMRAANDSIFPSPRLTNYRPDLRDPISLDQHRAESRERLRRMQATFREPAAKGWDRRA